MIQNFTHISCVFVSKSLTCFLVIVKWIVSHPRGVLFVVVGKWMCSKEEFTLRCNVEWKQQVEARCSCNDICVGEKWKTESSASYMRASHWRAEAVACAPQKLVADMLRIFACSSQLDLMKVSGVIHGSCIMADNRHIRSCGQHASEEPVVCAGRRLDFCSIWELKGGWAVFKSVPVCCNHTLK